MVAEVAAECDPFLQAIGMAHFPGTHMFQDVDDITPAVVESWASDTPFDLVLLIGGFPCKDLSRLKAGRKNLQGPQSGLFAHIPRILNLLRSSFTLPIFFLIENVVMDRDAQQQVSSELGVVPIRINSQAVSAAKRDRLYWVNFDVQPMPGESMDIDFHEQRLILVDDPRKLQILEPGAKTHATFAGAFE